MAPRAIVFVPFDDMQSLDLVADIHDEGILDPTTEDLEHRLARHGQQRLLRFMDDLLSTTTDAGTEECVCVVRAAELRARLIRQFRLELRLHQPPGAR